MAKSPRGTQYCIGLWLDHAPPPSALAAVHSTALSLPGIRPQDRTPTTWAPNLDFGYPADVDRIPGNEIYDALLWHKRLGPLRLTYEGTPERLPAAQHPVVIQFEAELDGIPQSFLSNAEKKQAKALDESALKLMRALCDSLDPAYALYTGEATIIPTPTALATKGDTLGDEFYVAGRLADPTTLNAHAEPWKHGTFIRTRTPHNDSAKEFSRRLGRTLRRSLRPPLA